jgi:hypothetical protein
LHIDHVAGRMVAMPFRTALTAFVAAMGLSGKIEPLTPRSVIEDGFSVCFSKARVEGIQADRGVPGDLPQVFSVGSLWRP